MIGERGSVPRSCKAEPTGQVPVVDRNRCEAKDDCVQVLGWLNECTSAVENCVSVSWIVL